MASHRFINLILLVAFLIWSSADTTLAACISGTVGHRTIETAQEVSAEFCVQGVAKSDEPSVFLWRLSPHDAAKQWSLEISTLPGQTAALKLQRLATGDSSTTLLREIHSSVDTGTVSTGPLIVQPGAYSIEVTGDGKAFYRLDAAAGEALPPATATGRQGAFRISLRAQPDGTAALPWGVDAALARRRWTLSLQAAAGISPNFELEDENGARIAGGSGVDSLGVVKIADLGLDPGDYRIAVSGMPDGGTAVLSAGATGARKPDFAEEPDNDDNHAHPLQPGVTLSGGLAGAWDTDTFLLDIGDDLADRRLDLIVQAPSGNDVTVELRSEGGEVLARRTGQGEIGMPRLLLKPGRYGLGLSGALAAYQIYTLRLEDRGPAPDGEEREPDDTVQTATSFGRDNHLHGELDGDDVDYLYFTVPPKLQLWRAAVTGAGVSRMDLVDPGGTPIATAMPSPERPDIALSNLLLGPGRHVIAVSGHGAYRALAGPTGPPSPDDEIEPNDDMVHAIALVPGKVRKGRLDHVGDTDVYAFHLRAEERVRLDLNVASGAAVQARLVRKEGGASEQVAQFTAPAGARKLVWNGMLPPGDYSLFLHADGADTSYALRFDLPPPFDATIDLEPNNEPWQAQRLGPDLQAFGTILDNDVDWFALPALECENKVTIVPKSDRHDLDLVVRGLAPGPYPPGESVEPIPVAVFSFDETDGFYSATLPAGQNLMLKVGGPAGDYDLDLVFSNGPQKRSNALAVDSRLGLSDTAIAAFRPEGQRVEGELDLTNAGANHLVLQLETFADDPRWRILPERDQVGLGPGEAARVPVIVEAAPDSWSGSPVRIAVRIHDADGAAASAMAAIKVGTDTPPVNPFPFSSLPKAMRGGFNAAWSAFGAHSEDDHPELIDGLVTDGASTSIDPDSVVTIRLAGTGPVPLVGVVLDLQGVAEIRDRLRRFRIEVSEDGASFAKVLTGVLSSRPGEQDFPFAHPVSAKFLRLVPLEAQGGPRALRFRLGELKAIAAPGWSPEDALDLMRPEAGGHVVRTEPQTQVAVTGPEATWPEDGPVEFPESSAAAEWVVGFHDDRLAKVVALEWTGRPELDEQQRIAAVDVFTSTDTALGPWRSLGTWRLKRGALTPTPWRFDHAISARYLRFQVEGHSAAGPVSLPQQIAVIEQAASADYRSILSEWGDGDGLSPRPTAASSAMQDGTSEGWSKDAAPILKAGMPVHGSVKRGVAENWFRVEVPAGTAQIRLALAGPAPHPSLTLEDLAGRPVALAGEAGEYRADIEAGTYFVRVSDPQRSVVLSWDTSISVAAYIPGILQGIRTFARDIRPGREKVNLVPFRGSGKPLLADWSDDMMTILGALGEYNVLENNSNAEAALVAANKILEGRAGAHAILLITDAQSDGFADTAELWRGFAQTRPRIFALRIPNGDRGKPARAERNLMQDWAGVNGGYQELISSRAEIKAAFDRLSVWLRRPVPYTLTVDFEGPPGMLVVQTLRAADDKAAPSLEMAPPSGATADAIEIILDASGSMLQRLHGKRRIDIARSALTDLVTRTLPPESQVALRVFGNDRPGSCETRLAAPLAPLDRSFLAKRIAGIQPKNLARTPLGASLRRVADDLGSETGQRTVVLVTDGEESCGGDPKAEIEALAASGIETHVNIVGFAVGDAALKETFRDWAKAGHGRYFDAEDKHELGASLRHATEAMALPKLPFTIFDAAGIPVLEGMTNDRPSELPAGEYSLVVSVSGRRLVRDVSISEGASTTVRLDTTAGELPGSGGK